MNKNKFLNRLKYILTTIALINLVLLFGFHYEIPSIIQDKFFPDQHSANSTASSKNSEDQTLQIHFDSDFLSYDGSDTLDLLEGVTVTDRKGNPLDLTLYATIESTQESTKKTITYTTSDEEGHRASADRTLLLKNYYGPVLAIGQPYPTVYDTELQFISTTFADSGLLSANDGYGMNITDSIQCDYTVTNDIATEVSVTFSVTNHFGDTASETISLPIARTKPLILLKEEAATLQVSEYFDPLSYVASATNEEGEDLTRLIKTEGTADTSTPGVYEIRYTLTDRDREKADPVTLLLTVKE